MRTAGLVVRLNELGPNFVRLRATVINQPNMLPNTLWAVTDYVADVIVVTTEDLTFVVAKEAMI